jgi:fructose-bisphosphate aldolase class II
MLVTLQRLLRPAQQDGYAVGAFNVSNLEQVQAVVTAAEELRSPVIINTSEKAIDYAGAPLLAAMVITAAKRSRVPVALNLDHGHHLVAVQTCLRFGWTGIMFDGSRLSDAENMRRTAQAVRLGRRRGIGVEGEIGHVKYAAEVARDPRPVLATPEQAVMFVRHTGVAALAVGIGNSHGFPLPNEQLDFRLLERIRRAVRVPLVLHGASSNSPAEIRRAIKIGISKINIDTELRASFTTAVRQALRVDRDVDPRSYLGPAREAMIEAVKKKMMLFGSNRQAS